MVTVGSVCEYCGNFVSSTSFKVDGEKKDAIHTSKQETIRAVQNAENGKWGVLDSEGLQIVPFEYDSVRIILPFVIIGKKCLCKIRKKNYCWGRTVSSQRKY